MLTPRYILLIDANGSRWPEAFGTYRPALRRFDELKAKLSTAALSLSKDGDERMRWERPE